LNNLKKGIRIILDHPEILVDQALNDIEELSNNNECYRQQGRELMNKNPNSWTVSQRSTPVRTKPERSGLEIRKTLARSSDDGGDKDPTKKNNEKSHPIYTLLKEKGIPIK
jgi:hypothetical protein